MSGERAHAAAWKTALDTPLGQWSAYDYDDSTLPDPLPDIYVLVTVSRRFGGDVRSDGRLTRKGWRLTTLAVGGDADEAGWAREKVATLEDKKNSTLDSSLLRFESENPIEPDNGKFSGLTVYTYATPA